jgi:phosphatidylinositol alpha-mannosyltransferase
VAGPGDVDEVRQQIPKSVRDRVHFLGLVSEPDKAAMLRSVDVYVAPNTGGESFGVVLLEAMASGTAVLASDIEAFERVLDRGRAGALFRVGDSADLAGHAVGLLSDPDERARLAAGATTAVSQYDWAQVARQVIAVYETVTWSGLKVREDSRGQALGRFTRLRDEP